MALDVIGFPCFPENLDSKNFHSMRKEIKKLVGSTAKDEKGAQFQTYQELPINHKMWESIYIEIMDFLSGFTDEDIKQAKEIALPKFFISKLYLTFGDKNIVTLLSILLLVYVLGISDNSVNESLDMENEVKVTGVDVVELHEKILQMGGRNRARGLYTDLYFDKKNGLLSRDGRQLRSRNKFLLDSTSPYGFVEQNVLTGKRELTKQEKTPEGFKTLSDFYGLHGQELDVSKLTNTMKLLFEEEMSVNSQDTFERILQIIHVNNSRAKIKLRVSDICKTTKIEAMEYYYWARTPRSPTGFMQPFSELELPLDVDPREYIEDVLGIRKYELSNAGSRKFFKEQGAEESYLEFMRGLKKDNETARRVLQIQSEGRKRLSEGCLDAFPEKLSA